MLTVFSAIKYTLTANLAWLNLGCSSINYLLHTARIIILTLVYINVFLKKRKILVLNAFKEQFSIPSFLKMQKLSLVERLYQEN